MFKKDVRLKKGVSGFKQNVEFLSNSLNDFRTKVNAGEIIFVPEKERSRVDALLLSKLDACVEMRKLLDGIDTDNVSAKDVERRLDYVQKQISEVISSSWY